MGLRSAGSIKLLRHGSAGTKGIGLVVVMSSEPETNIPKASPAGTIAFDREILSQPLGKTGMINRIYEKHYPSFQKRTPFAQELDTQLDVPQLWIGQHGTTAVTMPEDTRLKDIEFSSFHEGVEKIIDSYWSEPNFTPETYPGLRRITAGFGKYEIILDQTEDRVRLFLKAGGKMLAHMSYGENWPFELAMDNGVLKSAVDAKLMGLLGWSLADNPELFRALLDLMK
jgi:hypothetical protein